MSPRRSGGLVAASTEVAKTAAALALGRVGERADRAVCAVGAFAPPLGPVIGARIRRRAARSAGFRVWARLPEETLPVGPGQAIVVTGTLQHRAIPVARAWLVGAGDRREVALTPKAPAGGSADSASSDGRRRHRAKFRGRLVVRRWDGLEVPVVLEVQLLDGSRLTRELGSIRTTARSGHRAANVRWPSAGPRVVICLATYRPNADWLRQQLDSIRTQTHDNWVCIVSDDASGSPWTDEIHGLLAEDDRFVLLEHAENVGAYRNFERALGAIPRDAHFVAFCDQDDVWDEDKLETLLQPMADPRVSLTYSDMRLVDAEGTLLANSFWGRRRNKYDDLVALTTLNTVTGAASLVRADLVRARILPFPPAEGAYHDHWTAVIALAAGHIHFVDRPLYSYRQHEDAVTGHQDADVDAWLPSAARLVRAWRRPELLSASERWHLRRVASEELPRLATFAAVASARMGDELSTSDRWWLKQLASADRRVFPALALAIRSRGYRRTNLGAERVLAGGALWQARCRRASTRLTTTAGPQRPQRDKPPEVPQPTTDPTNSEKSRDMSAGV